jgi:hypothetical protein
VKRILSILTVALVMAAMMVAMAMPAFADPDCTGNPDGRPASCHDSGQPGSGNFVDNADGGTAVTNH